MSDEPQAVARFEWRALPRAGCEGVEIRLLVAREDLLIAMLRFQPGATIDEHAADHPVDVICLEGSGFISLEGRSHRFTASQSMVWTAGLMHRLWTDRHGMLTLMVERPRGGRPWSRPLASAWPVSQLGPVAARSRVRS